MSYFDSVVAKNSPRSVTFMAVTIGFLAMVRAWAVVHPTHRGEFIGSRALIAFELVKPTALLLVLCWVFVRNRGEDDRAVR